MSDVSTPKTQSAKRRGALLAGVVSLGLIGVLAAEAVFVPGGQAVAQQAVTVRPISTQTAAPLSFADVVDRVKPAVVSIRVRGEDRAASFDGPPDFEGSPLERFFREYGMPRPDGPRGRNSPGRPVMGQGSGFIISADGKIVTNYHVVKGASEVTVVMDDQREYKAKVLGSDEKTDLALVQIEARETFPTVSFTSGETRVGDWVVAVGNPFGLGGTVTAGIVSARGRDIGAGPYDDFLQIDAPINRGNSGGPTFNIAGEVVGVNTAIYSPSGGSVGIGFAIPAETVKRVVAQLEANGQVTRGWLGVQIQPITRDIADSLKLPAAKGALVSDPQPGSPAAKAGIRSGDAIVAVNGQAVDSPRDLARRIADVTPGSVAKVELFRDGTRQTVDVTIGTLQGTERVASARPDRTDTDVTSQLGLSLAPAQDVGERGQGLVITRIDPRSEARRRGLNVGDVIVEAQGRPLSSLEDLAAAVADARAEGRRAVLVRVLQSNSSRFVALPLTAS
jgi:serine protease Do